MAERMIEYADLCADVWGTLCGEAKDFVADYYMFNRDDYLTDLFGCRADNAIDIYTSDLYEWAKDHMEDVENAITEFGWEGVGKSLTGAIQMAEYNVYEGYLYDNQDEIRLAWALKLAKDIAEEEDIDIDSINFDTFEYDLDTYAYHKLDRLQDDVRDWLLIKAGKETA